MTDKTVKELGEQLSAAFEEFKTSNDAKLKAIEEKGHASEDLIQKVELINTDMTRLSKELKDVEKRSNRPNIAGSDDLNEDQREHKAAFSRWARKGDDANLRELERKAMTVGTDPNGGYFVTPEVEAMITRLMGVNSSFAGIATNRSIGTDSYKKRVRTSTGGGIQWVGEAEAPTETNTPTYGVLEFVAHTAAAEPQISQQALEDPSVNLEQEMLDALDQDFTEEFGSVFITGDGAKQPRGLLSYTTVANASYAWGNVGYIASGGAGAFAASNPGDNIIDLIHALKAGYRQGARFLTNDLTLAEIRQFKDGQGNYLWQPSFQAGIAGTLLGYPVSTDDNIPDVAANSYSLAFGDFGRAYLIVNRRGVAMLRDPYTSKPFVKFYTTVRIGGGIQNFEAFKVMKMAAS